MFNTLQTYVMIGLVVLLMTVSGAFYFSHKASAAREAGLIKEVATYSQAVEIQKKTIQELVADAEKQAQANRELSAQMRMSEEEFVSEWSAINALDLTSAEALANTDELERKVNAEFSRSIENLKGATGGITCTQSGDVCK